MEGGVERRRHARKRGVFVPGPLDISPLCQIQVSAAAGLAPGPSFTTLFGASPRQAPKPRGGEVSAFVRAAADTFANGKVKVSTVSEDLRRPQTPARMKSHCKDRYVRAGDFREAL